MALPTPIRSANAELAEGATDGKYKKVIRDRGGVVDSSTYAERVDLADVYYGIHEDLTKTNTDAKPVRTPNTVTTPAVAASAYI